MQPLCLLLRSASLKKRPRGCMNSLTSKHKFSSRTCWSKFKCSATPHRSRPSFWDGDLRFGVRGHNDIKVQFTPATCFSSTYLFSTWQRFKAVSEARRASALFLKAEVARSAKLEERHDDARSVHQPLLDSEAVRATEGMESEHVVPSREDAAKILQR